MSVPSSETWDGPQQANPSADDLALVLAAAKAHLASLGQAIARLEHSPESNTEDDPAVLRRLALAPPAESRAVGLEARPSGCHSKGAPSNKRATGQHWAPRSRPLGTRARRLVIGGLAFAVALLAIAMATSFVRVSVVKTGSMAPGMPAGSLLFSRRVPSASIGVGDVVTFQRPGGTGSVTHRVVHADETAHGMLLVTKGDANTAVDDWQVPLPTSTWRSIGSTDALAWIIARRGPWAHLVVTLAPAYIAAGLLLAWLWRPSKRGAPPAAMLPDLAG